MKNKIHDDFYFKEGHWIKKIWQTAIALLFWLLMIIPCFVTASLYRNIKSQEHYYEKLTQYDKYVDHYAISTHYFDLNKESLVKKWQDISDFHYKKMILTGIENYRDNQYADKYQIMIRQGSYFSNLVPLRELINR